MHAAPPFFFSDPFLLEAFPGKGVVSGRDCFFFGDGSSQAQEEGPFR